MTANAGLKVTCESCGEPFHVKPSRLKMARALVFARSLVGPSRATRSARSASTRRRRLINV